MMDTAKISAVSVSNPGYTEYTLTLTSLTVISVMKGIEVLSGVSENLSPFFSTSTQFIVLAYES